MKLDEGLLWKTVDGKSALIVFPEGCCLVAQDINEPKWIVIPLPEEISEEIRIREGDLTIQELRDGDDFAIVVRIGRDSLAYCSSLEARRFLVHTPTLLFTT